MNNNEQNNKLNNSLNDFKPRKWLLVILIIIALLISVVLANKAVVNFKTFKRNFFNFNTTNNDSVNDFDEKINETEKEIKDAKQSIDEARKKQEIDSFNSSFEMDSGTRSGFFVKFLLDSVIKNNKKNSEHLLIVVYDSHFTTDPDEIKNMKSEFDEWTNYEISLDYDEEGYVNKVTIEK